MWFWQMFDGKRVFRVLSVEASNAECAAACLAVDEIVKVIRAHTKETMPPGARETWLACQGRLAEAIADNMMAYFIHAVQTTGTTDAIPQEQKDNHNSLWWVHMRHSMLRDGSLIAENGKLRINPDRFELIP